MSGRDKALKMSRHGLRRKRREPSQASSHAVAGGAATVSATDSEVREEISTHFAEYESVLSATKSIMMSCADRHRVDARAVQRTLEWCEWRSSRVHVLRDAWTHSHFWPFVSSAAASRMVQEFPPLVVARLSSSRPGTITVTRLDLRTKYKSGGSKFRSAHRQYEVCDELSESDEGVLLAKSAAIGGDARVPFARLLALLIRDTCPLCLNNIQDISALSGRHEDYRTFDCRHSYHTGCLVFGERCEVCESAKGGDDEVSASPPAKHGSGGGGGGAFSTRLMAAEADSDDETVITVTTDVSGRPTEDRRYMDDATEPVAPLPVDRAERLRQIEARMQMERTGKDVVSALSSDDDEYVDSAFGARKRSTDELRDDIRRKFSGRR